MDFFGYFYQKFTSRMVSSRKPERMTMGKILIIKLGYSETLDSMLSVTTSLGDVLRTTFILHYFKGYEVNWLIDKNALPLLENNKYVKEIFIYSPSVMQKLKKRKFDIVINLEKLPEVCLFADSIKAKQNDSSVQ